MLRVDSNGISLDGVLIAPTVEHRPKQIAALIEPLGSRLAQLPDPKAFRAYELELLEGANLATVKSAFQSAAFAGWSYANLRIQAGTLLLTARVPKLIEPPDRHSLVATEAKRVLVIRPDETELWMNASIVERHLPPSSRKAGLGLKGDFTDHDPRVRLDACPTEASQAEATTWLQTYCTWKAPCSKAVVLLEPTISVAQFVKWATVFRETCRQRGVVDCELGLRIHDPPRKGEPPDQGYRAVRVGSTMVSGRLSPEVIQATVRSNYARIRECYEQGLAKDPKLRGRVELQFVIDRNGQVNDALLEERSTLPDAQTKECIRAVFPTIQFPQPEDGIVTVVYPLAFEPE